MKWYILGESVLFNSALHEVWCDIRYIYIHMHIIVCLCVMQNLNGWRRGMRWAAYYDVMMRLF